MKVSVEPGKYILAVSGGVDSMVLLDTLAKQKNSEFRIQNSEKNKNSQFPIPNSQFSFVVAHFNHGIRPDSGEDEQLVAAAAKRYGLPFEVGYGRLGAGASEEAARHARYEFLSGARARHGAGAIITAHHQDDLIETALINLLRGSGRRGLTAISDNPKVIRPLLGHTKAEILAYAQKNNLQWREDSTNQDTDYLRNYLRKNLIPKMDASQRSGLIKNLRRILKSGSAIDAGLALLAPQIRNQKQIDRAKFSALPAELGNELLIFWLRQEGLLDFDRPTINRLNVALRTAKSNSRHPVKKDISLNIGPKTARFERVAAKVTQQMI